MTQLQININYCGICNLLRSLEREFSREELQKIRQRIVKDLGVTIILTK